MNNIEKLKSYLNRLGEGEELESVRKDFVENFESVNPREIALAEQELIKSGVELKKIQKLCDLHSALFHGKTKEEQIENAEEAVMKALREKEEDEKVKVSIVNGHPIEVLKKENEELANRFSSVKTKIEKGVDNSEIIEEVKSLRDVSSHYSKKGDLIYPILNRNYGFEGPASVMWGVDDEIRDELRKLVKVGADATDFKDRLSKVIERGTEMIYKEENILFPLTLKEFSEEDWMRIYYEFPNYENLLGGDYPVWEEAEAKRDELKTIGGKLAKDLSLLEKLEKNKDGYITLGSGMMTPNQIEAVLNTIPIELTFVDKDDINRYFDKGEKIFKRPDMAIGKDMYACHPAKIVPIVKKTIASLKSGEKDSVDVWTEKGGEPVYIRYMAVRDDDGNYLGCLECVQKFGFAFEEFNKKSKNN